MANKVTLTSAPLVDENADEKTHTPTTWNGTTALRGGERVSYRERKAILRRPRLPRTLIPPPGARKKHKSRLHFDQKPSREEGNMTRVIKRVGGSCAQRTAAARWPD